MKRLSLSLVVSFALVALLAPSAFSDTITFSTTQYINGTGIGNTTNVLSLQQHGNAENEAGSVTPTSVSNGDAKPDSHTYTALQLSILGLNATNLGIVFNPNETGANAPDTLDVQSFSLDIYNGSSVLQGSASLTGVFPINIVPISTGTGSSGWLMDYHNTTGLLTTFFANPTWVLGATGSILNTDNGPDNFYLINVNSPQPGPIPEPGTMLLLGSGLVGLAGWGRKKFRK